jgi:Ni/Fe-hydrogenase subunit HybB-like protein
MLKPTFIITAIVTIITIIIIVVRPFESRAQGFAAAAGRRRTEDWCGSTASTRCPPRWA